MTAAIDIITGALGELNAYAPGEPLSAADAQTGLMVLNDLLDSWSTEHLTVYNNNEYTYTLSPGVKSYTVGPGGDINIPRPLRITNVYTRITSNGQGIDYPCDVVSGDIYTSIGLKSQPGPWPKVLYYNEDYPLGTLFFWPVPTQAGELHLWTDDIFTTFANITDTVNLPQGYKRALRKCLAVELAPMFGREPSQALLAAASQAKAVVKALNNQPQTPSSFEGGMPTGRVIDAGWILHGGFQ